VKKVPVRGYRRGALERTGSGGVAPHRRDSPGRSAADGPAGRTRIVEHPGGVRIYRLIDADVPGAPPLVKETGFFVPPAPPGNPTGTIQINHMLVDENGLIYANDRVTGGLYILQ